MTEEVDNGLSESSRSTRRSYFGYVLAKSTYSSIHTVCETNDHPEELIKNECFFQLVGYVLQYEYDSIFISRVADEKGTPHIVKIAIDYGNRVQEAKNKFIEEFFRRQKTLFVEPTLVLTAFFGSSIATVIMSKVFPKNLDNYPDKSKYAQMVVFFSGFWFIVESVVNFVELVKFDCKPVFYPNGQEW